MEKMLYISQMVQPSHEIEDFFVWWKNNNRFFVKTSYLRMYEICNACLRVEENILKELERVWKSNMLSKIQLFGWRLLLNKLATRYELAGSIVICGSHNVVCPMCGSMCLHV